MMSVSPCEAAPTDMRAHVPVKVHIHHGSADWWQAREGWHFAYSDGHIKTLLASGTFHVCF